MAEIRAWAHEPEMFNGREATYQGLIDARLNSMLIGEDIAIDATEQAAREILRQTVPPEFRDPLLYDKKQSALLRDQAIDGLFSCFFEGGRGRKVATRLRPTREEIVVTPDSDAFLFEAVFGMLEPGVIVAAPGYDERLQEAAGRYGHVIDTVSTVLPESFRIDIESLRSDIARHQKSGELRSVLITHPSKAAVEPDNEDEQQLLAETLVDADVPIICDIGMSQFMPKAAYTPLAMLTVRSSSGELVSLYDRVLSITSTEKAYGRLGMTHFGALCTGNPAMRDAVMSQLATFFQREQIHKARQIMAYTSPDYLRSNRDAMHRGQREAHAHVCALQKEFGERAIRIVGGQTGLRAGLLFDAGSLLASGIADSGELSRTLQIEAGILTVSLHFLGIHQPGVTANVVMPLPQRRDNMLVATNESYRKQVRAEFFDRVGALLEKLHTTR